MARKRGIRAWLITWKRAGDHVEIRDPLAAILNPRWSGDRVASYMQFIHDRTALTVQEHLYFLNRPRARPYQPAHGGPGSPYLQCGHNPFLEARLVSGLRLEQDVENETETLLWIEPTVRRIDPNSREVIEERPGRQNSLERPLGDPIGG